MAMSLLKRTCSIGLYGSSRRPGPSRHPEACTVSRRSASVRKQLGLTCQSSAVASVPLVGIDTGEEGACGETRPEIEVAVAPDRLSNKQSRALCQRLLHSCGCSLMAYKAAGLSVPPLLRCTRTSYSVS